MKNYEINNDTEIEYIKIIYINLQNIRQYL